MIWYMDNMSDATSRNRRNSVYNNSKNSVISTLRSKIKSANGSKDSESFDPMCPGCVIEREQILLNKKIIFVRKVYMIENKYKIGWIVDSDISFCMVCFGGFGWFGLKHHCRACGLLVCGKCSPFTTTVPYLEEENGSRVCKLCFGLKSAVSQSNPNTPVTTPTGKNALQSNKFSGGSGGKYDLTDRSSFHHSSAPNDFWHENELNNNSPKSTSSRRINSAGLRTKSTADIGASSGFGSSRALLAAAGMSGRMSSAGVNVDEELAELEKAMEPKYEEAYKIMRQIIPTDIYKSTYAALLEQGIPEIVAHRLWHTKILWLIVMHPDDIAKIHLADFRSKYSSVGLDILEMRAIWYHLPHWSGSDVPASAHQHLAGSYNSKSAMLHASMVSNKQSIEQGKYEWKQGFKARLDDMSYKEARGTLAANLIRNPVYEGHDIDLYFFDYEVPLKPRFDTSSGAATHQHQQQLGSGINAMDDDDEVSRNASNTAKFATRKQNYVNNASGAYGEEDDERSFAQSQGGRYQGEDVDEEEDASSYTFKKLTRNDKRHSAPGQINTHNSSSSNVNSHSQQPKQSQNSGNFSSNVSVASSLPPSATKPPRSSAQLQHTNNTTNDSAQYGRAQEPEYDPLDDIYNNKPSTASNTSGNNYRAPSVVSTQSAHNTAKNTAVKNKNNTSVPVLQTPERGVAAARKGAYSGHKSQVITEENLRNSNASNGSYSVRDSFLQDNGEDENYDDQEEEVQEYLGESQLLPQEGEEEQEGYGYGSSSSITNSLASNTQAAQLAKQVAEQQLLIEAQQALQQQHYDQIQLLHQQQLQMQQSHALNMNTNRVLSKFYSSRDLHANAAHQQQTQPLLFTPPPMQAQYSQQLPYTGGSVPYLVPNSTPYTPQQQPYQQQYQQSPFAQQPVGSGSLFGTPQQPGFQQQPGVYGASPSYFPQTAQTAHHSVGHVSGVSSPMQVMYGAGHVSSSNSQRQQQVPHMASTSLDSRSQGSHNNSGYNLGYPQQQQHGLQRQYGMLPEHINSGLTSPVRSSADSSVFSHNNNATGNGNTQQANTILSQLQQQNSYMLPPAAVDTQLQHSSQHGQQLAYSAGDITPPRRTSVTGNVLAPQAFSFPSEVTMLAQVPAAVEEQVRPVTPRSVLSADQDNTSGSVATEPSLQKNKVKKQQTQETQQAAKQQKQPVEKVNPVLLLTDNQVPFQSKAKSPVPFPSVSSAFDGNSTSNIEQMVTATQQTQQQQRSGSISAAGSVGTATPPRKKLVHSASIENISVSGSVNSAVAGVPVPSTPQRDILPAKPQYDKQELRESLIEAIRAGDVRHANQLLTVIDANGVMVRVTSAEASTLLLDIFKDYNSLSSELSQPGEVILLLIEKFQANVNVQDNSSGNTVLHYILRDFASQQESSGATSSNSVHRELTGLLMASNANILLDNKQGVSALTLALSQGIEWFLQEFESTGQEFELLTTANQFVLFKYATSLILSGYAVRAGNVIGTKRVIITADDATELLSSCSGNFDAMREPVETFELLESLGAKVV